MERRKETILISVLLITALAHVLDFVVLMPLGPKLMREFDISAADFGKLVSAYTFAAAASSFFSTVWVDRINRRTSMIILLIGFTIANGICAWSPTVEMLVFGRVLAGVFGGVITALIYSIIGQSISLTRRGRASGLIGTAFPLISIIGVPFALKIADIYSWRSTFLFVVSLSFVALMLCAFVLPSIKPVTNQSHSKNIFSPIVNVLKHPPHILGIILIIFIVFGGFVIVPYIAPFLVNNGYIPENQLYLMYLIGGAFSIVASRTIGFISDKVGKIKTLRVNLILAMIAVGIFTNLPNVHIAVVLAATTFLMSVLPTRIVCVMAWMTIIAKPDLRGSYMSFIATLQQLAVGSASIVGGILVGEGSNSHITTFWQAGILAIAANFIVLLISPLLLREEEKAMSAQI